MATQTGSIDLKAVSQAGATAEEVNQYFWFNSTASGQEGAGAHITQKDKTSFVADPANGGGNTLMTSNGMEVRDGTTTLAKFIANAITLGTNDGNQLNLTPNAIAFVIAGQTIAYIAQDKLMTTNAELSGALFVGDYYVRQKSNGKLAVGLRR